jgi:hypothetical protein
MKSDKALKPIQYPSGSQLRAKQICFNAKTGQPGLLPISTRTWLRWVELGKVQQGVLLGSRTRVWPIETVLAVGQGEMADGAKGKA